MYSVVIVDDNKIAVTAIARSTHWENFQCEVTGVAYDGIAGLELIHKECPDIVIIDIQMPGFNGLDIIEKLNQQKQDTQFIIISGYSHFEYAQKAIRYGVSDFLLKPIMTDELEQALKKAVDTLSRNKEREEEEETDSLEGKVQSIRSNREEYSKLVFNAIDYVERNIQRNISLSDICEELLISTSYFSKCFKKETGVGSPIMLLW